MPTRVLWAGPWPAVSDGIDYERIRAESETIAKGTGTTFRFEPTYQSEPAPTDPRVRRVIHLFMHGGPSHVDLFDPKPRLNAEAVGLTHDRVEAVL